MPRPVGDIHKVIRPLGIRLVDVSEHSPTMDRRKVCACRRTLRKLINAHGEGHLSLVLKLIVQSEGNSTELYRDTILAVSGLIASFPEIEAMPTLFDWMDELDLHDMRWKAKDTRVYPVHKAMQTLLVVYFEEAIKGEAA